MNLPRSPHLRYFALCALLLALAAGSARAQDPSPLEERVNEARKAFFSMQDERALDLIKDILLQDPYHVGARDLHARCLRNLGQFEQAVSSLQKLPELPRESRRVLGECLGAIPGRSAEAHEIFDAMLAENPEDFEAMISRARIMVLEDRADEALREAFTARELAPKNLEAQVVFAHCLQLNTNLGEATRILQDLLKDQAQFAPFDPHHLREAVYILATVQRLLARYLAAANFYGQMIKYTPDEPLLYGHLADVLFLAGKQEDAEAAYRKAIELGPRLPTFYVRLGNALQSAGKHPEAIENYQKALELLDDPAVPSWRLAQIYLQQGQLTKATIHVEAAIATMGDDPEVQLIAARVLAKRGEVERAKAAFRRSIELDPTIFEAQHGLAELLRQSSDKSEQREGARLAELYSRVAPHMPRIERLRQELFLTPENGLLITRMAMLLNAIGQFQAAVPWVTEAVSANPRQPQARLTAAYIAANLGGMQRALTYFEEVQKLLGEGSESPEVQAYIDTIKNGGKLPTPLGAQTSDD